MKNKTKALIAAITLLFILPLTVTPASATKPSSPNEVYGEHSSGICCATVGSPIVLEGQKITFNIVDYPSNYYESPKDLKSYTSSVTAEYTLLNPTSETETLTIAIPIGMRADYG